MKPIIIIYYYIQQEKLTMKSSRIKRIYIGKSFFFFIKLSIHLLIKIPSPSRQKVTVMSLTVDKLLTGLGTVIVLPIVFLIGQASPDETLNFVGQVAGRLSVHVGTRIGGPAHPELRILNGRFCFDTQIKVRFEDVTRVIRRRSAVTHASIETGHGREFALVWPTTTCHLSILQMNRMATLDQRRTASEVEILLREHTVAIVP